MLHLACTWLIRGSAQPTTRALAAQLLSRKQCCASCRRALRPAAWVLDLEAGLTLPNALPPPWLSTEWVCVHARVMDPQLLQQHLAASTEQLLGGIAWALDEQAAQALGMHEGACKLRGSPVLGPVSELPPLLPQAPGGPSRSRLPPSSLALWLAVSRLSWFRTSLIKSAEYLMARSPPAQWPSLQRAGQRQRGAWPAATASAKLAQARACCQPGSVANLKYALPSLCAAVPAYLRQLVAATHAALEPLPPAGTAERVGQRYLSEAQQVSGSWPTAARLPLGVDLFLLTVAGSLGQIGQHVPAHVMVDAGVLSLLLAMLQRRQHPLLVEEICGALSHVLCNGGRGQQAGLPTRRWPATAARRSCMHPESETGLDPLTPTAAATAPLEGVDELLHSLATHSIHLLGACRSAASQHPQRPRCCRAPGCCAKSSARQSCRAPVPPAAPAPHPPSPLPPCCRRLRGPRAAPGGGRLPARDVGGPPGNGHVWYPRLRRPHG